MRSYACAFVCLAISVAADETCYMPIDVMFLQDTTGSFEDDLPNVVRQIPSMVAQILEQNPDSHFGVSEFKDKPFYPLGIDSDFCYKLDGALTPLVEEFEYDYSLLYASGGGDLPEAQFQALIDVAQDPSVGWRTIQRPATRASSFAGAHLVIISTDAPPHLNGDVAKFHQLYPETVPGNLGPNPGYSPNGDFQASCRNYDYPTPQEMADALKAQAIYLAILTPNESNITAAWKWVNEGLLNQPAGFYQFIEADSSDLIEGVMKVIKEVTETACAETVPPEYTTPATTAPTTTKVTPTTTTTAPTTTTTTVPTTTTTVPTTTTTTTVPTTTTTTTVPTTTTTTTVPTTTTTVPTTTTTTTVPTTTTTVPTTTTTTTVPTTTTTVPTTTTTTRPTTTTTPTTTSTTPTLTTLSVTTPTMTTSTTTEVITEATTESTIETSTFGSTESESTEGCHNPCPPVGPCCEMPAVIIKVHEKPKLLIVQYEK